MSYYAFQMPPEALIDQERSTLRAERSFFSHFDNERTPSRGTLTTFNPTIITRFYPGLIGAFLDMYNLIEVPVRSIEPLPPQLSVSDIVYNRFLVEKAKKGEVVSDTEAKEFKSRIESEASEQLNAYAVYLGTNNPSSSQEEEDDDIKSYASIFDYLQDKPITNEGRKDSHDITYEKKSALKTIETVRQNITELYGAGANAHDVLLTELLLEAPFVEEIVISQNSGEDIPTYARDEHETYIREAAAFASNFSLSERVNAFEDLTHECRVDVNEGIQIRDYLDEDKEYVGRLHKLAQNIRSGEWSMDDLYTLLGSTIFRRGKIFKYSTENSRGFVPADLKVVDFSEIAGYEEETNYYKTFIKRLKENNPALAGVRIVLVVGPPGSGKSLGIKALLSNLPENAKGLVFNYQEVRRNMPSYEDLVETANMHPRDHLIVALEDIDQSNGNEGLLEIDSVGATEMPANLHFFATTTKPEKLDRAVMRRVSKLLQYGIPDKQERAAITKKQMERRNLALPPNIFSAIVEKSSGFSPSEIQDVISSLEVECEDVPTIKDVEKFVAELKFRKGFVEKRGFWNR